MTSFLTPGEHTFVTKVTTTDGQTTQVTTTARVGMPVDPPAAPAGRWARVVTAADVAKEPDPADGSTAGRWTLTFDSVGLVFHDPQQPGGANDVVYSGAGHLIIRPSIETPPFPRRRLVPQPGSSVAVHVLGDRHDVDAARRG